ncbi:hypothetical protein VNO77_44494 [Canavalia gladiata]|uniref:Uncharacterized protein n=1 Tax=Canavalia gladiata TaxID=3824 RepID=A0AAN9JZ23_CANGL
MNTLLPTLEYLTINNCPKIESFPDGGLPPSLRTLHIENCYKLLRSLYLASMDMLSELRIEGPCEEVKSSPKEGLVSSASRTVPDETLANLAKNFSHQRHHG